MGARGARRDPHPGRDQPGVLALRDPDQHLDLARGEHPQQPPPLVVGLDRRVEEFGERAPQQLRRDGALPRPRLEHRPLHPVDALVVPDVPGGPGGERGGDPARTGHRPEHDDRHLRAVPGDARDRVEGSRRGGRGRTEQADVRRSGDHQLRRTGRRGRRREHPVAAQFQCRGQCLGEQAVIVDHHEPHAHRTSPPVPCTPRIPAPRPPAPASYTLVRRRAGLPPEKPPDCGIRWSRTAGRGGGCRARQSGAAAGARRPVVLSRCGRRAPGTASRRPGCRGAR
ncbi:hypothetical protein EES43_11125 [Streptomyces sp. ADI96-02]|nr:hypothetical protein EES43_11125 [Streptomyces sp. ADI96-02]